MTALYSEEMNITHHKSEHTALLSPWHHARSGNSRCFRSSSSGVRYCIRSKSALLILSWSMMVTSFQFGIDPSALLSTGFGVPTVDPMLILIIWVPVYGGIAFIWLFLPLAGYLADVCFGRFKATICSLSTVCISLIVGGCTWGPLLAGSTVSADDDNMHFRHFPHVIIFLCRYNGFGNNNKLHLIYCQCAPVWNGPAA